MKLEQRQDNRERGFQPREGPSGQLIRICPSPSPAPPLFQVTEPNRVWQENWGSDNPWGRRVLFIYLWQLRVDVTYKTLLSPETSTPGHPCYLQRTQQEGTRPRLVYHNSDFLRNKFVFKQTVPENRALIFVFLRTVLMLAVSKNTKKQGFDSTTLSSISPSSWPLMVGSHLSAEKSAQSFMMGNLGLHFSHLTQEYKETKHPAHCHRSRTSQHHHQVFSSCPTFFWV